MSILSPVPGETFMFRSHKRLNSNPSLGWVNTYEFVAGSATTHLNLLQAMGGVVEMERSIHLSEAVFFKRVVSTWVPDGTPYDPAAFLSVSTPGLVGARSATDGLPLNIVAQVNRQVPIGRQGKLFYRRVLAESEITSPAGDVVITPAAEAAIQAEIDLAQTSPLMAPYLLPFAAEGNYAMLAVGQTPRLITAFVLSGARVVPYNHRYFDRI